MRLEFDMPFRIESLNVSNELGIGRRVTIAKLRAQRFAQRGKVSKQRLGARLMVMGKLPPALRIRLLEESDRLVITLTRIGPGELDKDNLAGGFKAVRDGVADAFRVTDRHPMLRWFYRQESKGKGVYGCRVLFETMTAKKLGARLAAQEEASA